MSNETIDYTPLPKHKYPLLIKLFFFLTVIVSVFTFSHFILFELNKRVDFYCKLKKAERAFSAKNYEEAMSLYKKFLSQYPSHSDAKIKLAKSYLALSKDTPEFFFEAFTYLKGSYPISTIKEIGKFVPEVHKGKFKQLFELT